MKLYTKILQKPARQKYFSPNWEIPAPIQNRVRGKRRDFHTRACRRDANPSPDGRRSPRGPRRRAQGRDLGQIAAQILRIAPPNLNIVGRRVVRAMQQNRRRAETTLRARPRPENRSVQIQRAAVRQHLPRQIAGQPQNRVVVRNIRHRRMNPRQAAVQRRQNILPRRRPNQPLRRAQPQNDSDPARPVRPTRLVPPPPPFFFSPPSQPRTGRPAPPWCSAPAAGPSPRPIRSRAKTPHRSPTPAAKSCRKTAAPTSPPVRRFPPRQTTPPKTATPTPPPPPGAAGPAGRADPPGPAPVRFVSPLVRSAIFPFQKNRAANFRRRLASVHHRRPHGFAGSGEAVLHHRQGDAPAQVRAGVT